MKKSNLGSSRQQVAKLVDLNMVQQCAGCELPIADKFLFKVLDRVWHANCVQCTDCKCSLTERCFSRDGKLYCKEDFYR